MYMCAGIYISMLCVNVCVYTYINMVCRKCDLTGGDKCVESLTILNSRN